MTDRPNNLFGSAIDALYGPNSYPHSLFYRTAGDPYGMVVPLREVVDPTVLPPYWTLSVPCWYDPIVGTEEYQEPVRTRQLVQTFTQDAKTGVEVTQDAFDPFPPFLVLEVDYLICGKDDAKTLAPEEVTRRKQLQVAAMTEAFIRTAFPFAVLVHSGGKSLHAYIRLSDTQEAIQAFRQNYLGHLIELCWMVFGNFDRSVLKESGRVRLVRTPGALREDGKEQKILAVGKPVAINDLFAWFYSQLSQEAVAELRTRQPVLNNAPGGRFYSFWQEEWKRDLLQDHNQGERGTHWMYVSKKLAMAGQRRPEQHGVGVYTASWLWWFSAFVFNDYAKGWFFSQDLQDHQQHNERSRWWGVTEINGFIAEQRRARGIDQATAVMMANMTEAKLVEQESGLPAPRDSGSAPVPLQGDPDIDLLKEEAPVGKQKKEKKTKEGSGFDARVWAEKFFATYIARESLVYCGDLSGEQWWYFNDAIWIQTSTGGIKALICNQLMADGVWEEKQRNEVFAVIKHSCYTDKQWEEKQGAVAFANGTLYVDVVTSKVEFRAEFNREDHLRTQIPYVYEPTATCERWEKCMERFLPDVHRRNLFQEMFGYTLMPGQPYQSFFLLLGTGSNFKSTAIKVLEEMHKDSREAITLASLANEFALGTAFNKKLCVDADADSLGKQNAGDNARIMTVVKAWTGGDVVKVAVKKVQGWSTKMNPKLVLAANKRPRFIDPTKGVWRRLKIICFNETITEGEAIADYDRVLIQNEMSGIIVWAVKGLLRLIHQRGFTTSAELRKDLEEYQLDNDNTLQFMKEYLAKDAATGWYDLRPIYQAYRDYASTSGTNATALNEFKNRLHSHGVKVDQPALTESVHGVPAGSIPHPDHHHWAIHGYRCLHPIATLSAGIGAYPAPPGTKVINGLPMFARQELPR